MPTSPRTPYWDWLINHVGSVYGTIDEVASVFGASSFKEFPPRSFPPSFNPANILESMMQGIKEDKRLKGQLDLDRIRGGLNRMIEEQLRERAKP